MNYIYKLALNNDNICISDKMYSIHGLWPDYSNNSYPQYCHLENNCSYQCSHNINNCNLNISKFISSDTYNDMTKYWCSYDMSMNNNFWCHEWCKHGCCTNLNITEYFNIALTLFKNITEYSKYYCYTEIKKGIFKLIKC